MSDLIFEISKKGRRCTHLPQSEVESTEINELFLRNQKAQLPEVAEVDLVRHYTNLSKKAYGVDNGFYPLGSCTMKYNPKVNEDAACLKGFTDIHPLQPLDTLQGCLEAGFELSEYLCEITGMDTISLNPAAGAHGEYTGLCMIKAYLENKGETQRIKLLVPDSAHGTNPASASMNGFDVVNIPSTSDGIIDLTALKSLVGDDTAALMLTNPNTLGLFDKNIEEIANIIHNAGGLLYYDGANMNAIMGIVRPGDMGFDVVHLNLHKTFSTPHGGGGPGSGPVGCKAFLSDYLPYPLIEKENESYLFAKPKKSIGKIGSFYGNFLVTIKALSYILTLGAEGLKEASVNAVLNANYMQSKLKNNFDIPYEQTCMHEFVVSLEKTKGDYGINAADIAKGLIDKGFHPPTMYFPLIVHEALMIEPTETESKETLDKAISAFFELLEIAKKTPEKLHAAPISTPIGRPDETKAVRTPKLRY